MNKDQLSLIAGLVKNSKACDFFLERDYPKNIFYEFSDRTQQVHGAKEAKFLAHCALAYYEKHGEMLTWDYVLKCLKRKGASRPKVRTYLGAWEEISGKKTIRLGFWKEKLEDCLEKYREYRHMNVSLQALEMYKLPCLGNHNKGEDRCKTCPFQAECRLMMQKEETDKSLWILDWAATETEQIKIDTRGTHIRVYTSEELVHSGVTALEVDREQLGPDGKLLIKGCPTPFPSLTANMGGWLPKRLYMVGSRTGEGKSAFLLQSANVAVENGYHVLYFNLEMPVEEELRYRVMSYFCNVSFADLMTKRVDDKTMDHIRSKIEEWSSVFGKDNYTIVDIPLQTKLETILKMTDNHLVKIGTKKLILIIDYWNLLYCAPDTKNVPLWWAHQTEVMHAFCRSRDISGLSAVQLNRLADGVKKASIKHLRDSDKMGDNLDGLWVLLRRTDYLSYLQCVKSRYFDKMHLYLKRDLDKMRFIERGSQMDRPVKQDNTEEIEGYFKDEQEH